MSGSPVDASQALADLCWAIESPAFAEGPGTEGPASVVAEQIDLDHLVATLGQVPPRVGHYFERLVRYWLVHCEGVELEAAGLQLSDPETGRTLGELDFVFTDVEGRRCHWETAVKFFLYDPARPGSHFPGPNVRDDYESKIAKLFEEQLTRTVPSLGSFDRRRAFVKGCCFHHPLVGAPETLPERMPSKAMTGTWIRAAEVELVTERWSGHAVAVLNKPHWLAPQPGAGVPLDDFAGALRQHFGTSRRTVMAAVLDGDGDEVERLCVVHDAW